jgi:uncharacterized Zn finger protein (UPF0148 family)
MTKTTCYVCGKTMFDRGSRACPKCFLQVTKEVNQILTDYTNKEKLIEKQEEKYKLAILDIEKD